MPCTKESTNIANFNIDDHVETTQRNIWPLCVFPLFYAILYPVLKVKYVATSTDTTKLVSPWDIYWKKNE